MSSYCVSNLFSSLCVLFFLTRNSKWQRANTWRYLTMRKQCSSSFILTHSFVIRCCYCVAAALSSLIFTASSPHQTTQAARQPRRCFSEVSACDHIKPGRTAARFVPSTLAHLRSPFHGIFIGSTAVFLSRTDATLQSRSFDVLRGCHARFGWIIPLVS